jgi:primosomal protein N''
MNIVNYVSSLLPRINKSDVSKNLEDLRKELSEQTVKPYQSAVETFDEWTFKSDFAKEYDKLFAKEVKTRFRGSYIDVTHDILNRALENLTTIERLVKKMYANDIIASAISYSETQLLQLIEVMSFAAKYSRKMLIHTVALELDTHRKRPLISSRLTPAEVKWLQDYKMVFIHSMRTLSHDSRSLEKLFAEIPDIEVDAQNANNVVSSVGMAKLDPLNLSAQGLILNPIYHVRMVYTEWQVARYDAAKEERKMLEYQILDMKNEMEGKSDPKLEKALEYTEDRLSRLNYKIEKIEEEAAA